MEITIAQKNQWTAIKKIYLESFPKRERKPFLSLRYSAATGKTQIFTVSDKNKVAGFAVLIPYHDMVMVDYLAVSQKIRSRGTGSKLLQEICRYFSDRRMVLLIERLDEQADNKEQRIARRKFYLKNGCNKGYKRIYCFLKLTLILYSDIILKLENISVQKHIL